MTAPDLLRPLAERLPGWRIELRRTRSSLLGMRRDPLGRPVLRVHPDILLSDPEWSVPIREWALRHGRGGTGAALRELLRRCSQRISEQRLATDGAWAGGLDTWGNAGDLQALAGEIHRGWFADLPPASVAWGRLPPRRRLSHLRFGCYRRRTGAIELSPRLHRPWIARLFIAHVLHHEYCHHRQALTPAVRREAVHGPSFRAWERSFPGYAAARRWERLALPWLLDDARPPWYPEPRSQPCTVSALHSP